MSLAFIARSGRNGCTGPAIGGTDGGTRMGLRRAVADYVHAIANYLLGRDIDVGHRTRRAAQFRTFRGLPSTERGMPTRGATTDVTVERRRQHIAHAVEEARHQWVAARNFLDNVSEPELIDYAVFSIGAAEKRYMYLLAEARRHGVEVHPLRPLD